MSAHADSGPVNIPEVPDWLRWWAGGVWAVLAAALTAILHAGLMALDLPALRWSGPWLWVVAAAITSADAVLVIGARSHGRRWMLLPAGGLFALTLGLETASVQVALRAEDSEAAAETELVALAEADLERAERLREQAAEACRHWRATEPVWSRDGNPANDGELAAAEAEWARVDQLVTAARGALADQRRRAAATSATVHPLASNPEAWRWIVGGVAVLKLASLALAALVHGGNRTSRPLLAETVSGPRGGARTGLRPPAVRKQLPAGLARVADRLLRGGA